MGTREAKLSMPRPSVYRLEKLARQWSVMFKEPVTESDILQMALDENFCVHVHSSGIRSVMLRSREKVLARKPAIAIPAYMDEQYIKLSDHQIRALLSDNTITVSLLWLNEHEIKLIQGDSSFELSDVEAVVVDESERITITPDNIKLLYVMNKDVAAFEEKLRQRNRTSTNRQVVNSARDEEKPWLMHNPDDPKPFQPWYTPARYFARDHVIKDSTLIGKRNQLVKKIAVSLDEVGIKKRGGKKPLDPSTILKALSNVNYY